MIYHRPPLRIPHPWSTGRGPGWTLSCTLGSQGGGRSGGVEGVGSSVEPISSREPHTGRARGHWSRVSGPEQSYNRTRIVDEDHQRWRTGKSLLTLYRDPKFLKCLLPRLSVTSTCTRHRKRHQVKGFC